LPRLHRAATGHVQAQSLREQALFNFCEDIHGQENAAPRPPAGARVIPHDCEAL
jgi:hypothetical protein